MLVRAQILSVFHIKISRACHFAFIGYILSPNLAASVSDWNANKQVLESALRWMRSVRHLKSTTSAETSRTVRIESAVPSHIEVNMVLTVANADHAFF